MAARPPQTAAKRCSLEPDRQDHEQRRIGTQEQEAPHDQSTSVLSLIGWRTGKLSIIHHIDPMPSLLIIGSGWPVIMAGDLLEPSVSRAAMTFSPAATAITPVGAHLRPVGGRSGPGTAPVRCDGPMDSLSLR